MKTRVSLALVLSAALALPASAGAAGAGTASLTFLKFPTGARALAMGEAGSSTVQGADALFWNPANLRAGRSVDLELNHQPVFEFMNYDAAAASWSNDLIGTGLGFARLTQKDLDVLDLSGTKVGSAQAYDQQFAGGFAIGRRRWGAGVAAKFIQSRLDDVTGTAFAGDVGFAFPGVFRRLNHAVVVQNIGSSVSYDRESYALPLIIRGGSALSVGPAVLAVDVVKPSDEKLFVATGAEVPVLRGSKFQFRLRGGYRTQHNDLGDLAGLSVGAGLQTRGFRLDYAWRPNGDFGDSHNISLGYSFDVTPMAPVTKHGKPVYRKNESGKYRLPDLPKR
jgi:hypothetical protein